MHIQETFRRARRGTRLTVSTIPPLSTRLPFALTTPDRELFGQVSVTPPLVEKWKPRCLAVLTATHPLPTRPGSRSFAGSNMSIFHTLTARGSGHCHGCARDESRVGTSDDGIQPQNHGSGKLANPVRRAYTRPSSSHPGPSSALRGHSEPRQSATTRSLRPALHSQTPHPRKALQTSKNATPDTSWPGQESLYPE